MAKGYCLDVSPAVRAIISQSIINTADKIKLGLALCELADRHAGKILDLGLLMLQTLRQEDLPVDERGLYWPLVGIISWVESSQALMGDLTPIEVIEKTYPDASVAQTLLLIWKRIPRLNEYGRYLVSTAYDGA